MNPDAEHDRHGLRKLLVAQSLSQLGFYLLGLAMPLLAATTLHASALQVSAVAASQTAAFLLLGLPAGAWVDRLRKRPLMIGADLTRATILASIPIARLAGLLSIGYLCATAFVVGVCSVVFDIADQSYLPRLVGRAELVPANIKLAKVEQLAAVAGPGLGGLAIQAAGPPIAVLATSTGYLCSAVCIAIIVDRERKPKPATRPRLARDIAEGIRYVTADRILRPLVACSTTITLFWSMSYAMLLVLLARNLAVPAQTIGILLTVGSLGGVAGTLAARRLIDSLGDSTALRLSVLCTAPCSLLATLVQPGWRIWLVSAASFALIGGLVVYNVAQVSFRQRSVPTELLGRVNATMRFFAWGARPIGALGGGVTAQLFGLRQAVLVGAVGTSLAWVWLYLSPLRTMRVLSPANQDTALGLLGPS
jgi:predicted MFS family arabinose efflux permease